MTAERVHQRTSTWGAMRPVLGRFAPRTPGVVFRPPSKRASWRNICVGSALREPKAVWRHMSPAAACGRAGAGGPTRSVVAIVHGGTTGTAAPRRGLAVGARGDDNDGSDGSDGGDGGDDSDEDGAPLPHVDGEAVDEAQDEETAWRNRTVAEAGGEHDIDRAIAELENGSGIAQPASQLQPQSSTAPFLKEVIALPLLRRPMFPGTIQPITLTDSSIVPKALAALQKSGHAYVGAFYSVSDQLGSVTDLDQIHPMGMLASVERMESTNDGGTLLLLRAHRRIRVTGVAEDEPILRVSFPHARLILWLGVAHSDCIRVMRAGQRGALRQPTS